MARKKNLIAETASALAPAVAWSAVELLRGAGRDKPALVIEYGEALPPELLGAKTATAPRELKPKGARIAYVAGGDVVETYVNGQYVGSVSRMRGKEPWFANGGGDLELGDPRGKGSRYFANLEDAALALAHVENSPPPRADRQAQAPAMAVPHLMTKPNRWQWLSWESRAPSAADAPGFKVLDEWNPEIGGSKLGHIRVGYDRLVEAFGKPIRTPEGVNGEWWPEVNWYVVFEDGSKAMIYDWKVAGPMEENGEWHVIGCAPALGYLAAILGLEPEQVTDERILFSDKPKPKASNQSRKLARRLVR